MSTRVFVGGLAWKTDDASLRDCFEKFGKIESARVVTERETGRSRGFGFVNFEEAGDAAKAVEELNDYELDGRTIRVDLAKDREGGGGGERRDRYERRDDRGGDRRNDRYDDRRRDDRRDDRRRDDRRDDRKRDDRREDRRSRDE